MLYFTFTVQEGPYADRNTWANACLWSGALYTIINLLKAIGEYDNLIDGKELTIPELPEFYIGKELIVRRGVNQKSKEKNPDDDPENWIEVRGFASAKNAAVGSSSSAASGPKSSNSLLP
jgi:hypothetical protein